MEWLSAYRAVTEASSVTLLVLYGIQIYRTWSDLFYRDGGIRRVRASVIALGAASSVLQVVLHVDSFACFQIYPVVVVALLWSLTCILLSMALYFTSYQLVSTTFKIMYDPAKRRSAQRKWKILMASLIVFHTIWLLGRAIPHAYPYEIILWAAFIVGSFNLVIIAAVTYQRLRNAVIVLRDTQSSIHVAKLNGDMEEKLMKNVRLWRHYLIYLAILSVFSTAYFSVQIRSLLIARQTRLDNGEEIMPFFFAPGSICDGSLPREMFRVNIRTSFFSFTELVCQVLMLVVTAILLYRHWKDTRKVPGADSQQNKRSLT